MYIYIYTQHSYQSLPCPQTASRRALGGLRPPRGSPPGAVTYLYLYYTGVCGETNPPDKKTGWKASFQNQGLESSCCGRGAGQGLAEDTGIKTTKTQIPFLLEESTTHAKHTVSSSLCSPDLWV